MVQCLCLVIFCVLSLYAGWRNGQPLALSTTNWHKKSEAGIIRTINFVRRPIFGFMKCETRQVLSVIGNFSSSVTTIYGGGLAFKKGFQAAGQRWQNGYHSMQRKCGSSTFYGALEQLNRMRSRCRVAVPCFSIADFVSFKPYASFRRMYIGLLPTPTLPPLPALQS